MGGLCRRFARQTAGAADGPDLPGQGQELQVNDKEFRRKLAGYHRFHDAAANARSSRTIIKASRKRRIATGAGVPVQEVNRLLKQFEQMQQMMKMMKGGNLARMMRNMKGMMPGMR